MFLTCCRRFQTIVCFSPDRCQYCVNVNILAWPEFYENINNKTPTITIDKFLLYSLITQLSKNVKGITFDILLIKKLIDFSYLFLRKFFSPNSVLVLKIF